MGARVKVYGGVEVIMKVGMRRERMGGWVGRWVDEFSL